MASKDTRVSTRRRRRMRGEDEHKDEIKKKKTERRVRRKRSKDQSKDEVKEKGKILHSYA